MATAVALGSLKAELVAAGWSVFKETDWPEAMLRLDEGGRTWHQIHATTYSVDLSSWIDSTAIGDSIQSTSVSITDPLWQSALAIINKHVLSTPDTTP